MTVWIRLLPTTKYYHLQPLATTCQELIRFNTTRYRLMTLTTTKYDEYQQRPLRTTTAKVDDFLTGVLRLVFALSSHDVCALYPLLTYFLVVTHRSLATPARLTYYVFLVDVCLSGYLLATQSLLTDNCAPFSRYPLMTSLSLARPLRMTC